MVPLLLTAIVMAAAPIPALIRVDPAHDATITRPDLNNGVTVTKVEVVVVSTLNQAATALATALSGGSRDIVVELARGPHRVPSGGLRLTHEHTPAHASHVVSWQCEAGAGSCSVHGAYTKSWCAYVHMCAHVRACTYICMCSACPPTPCSMTPHLTCGQRPLPGLPCVPGPTGYLLGGDPITGWLPCTAIDCPTKGTMVAPTPVALKNTRLRHLYVDGVRANRTRTNATRYNLQYAQGAALDNHHHQVHHPQPLHPDSGCAGDYGEHIGDPVCCGQKGAISHAADICPKSVPHCHGFVQNHAMGVCRTAPSPPSPQPPPGPPMPSGSMGYIARGGNLSGWVANPDDIEFVYSGVGANWGEARCAVENIDSSAGAITMQQPCMWNLYHRPWQPVRTQTPPYIDNIRADLASPGQVYFDRAKGQVLYIPLPGQDLANASVVAAVEETLLLHNGTAQHTWNGVTFEYVI